MPYSRRALAGGDALFLERQCCCCLATCEQEDDADAPITVVLLGGQASFHEQGFCFGELAVPDEPFHLLLRSEGHEPGQAVALSVRPDLPRHGKPVSDESG